MKKIAVTFITLMVASLAFAAPPTIKSASEYRGDAEQICAKEWTTRGELDRDMYDFCVSGQEDGYQQLLAQASQYGGEGFFSDVAYPYCSNEWTKRGVANAEMIAFCLDQEIEGWKDVVYFRKQHGAAKVDMIVAAAIADYSSWNMAAYSVKNQFE